MFFHSSTNVSFPSSDLSCPLVEDRSPAASLEVITETGPLLPVQLSGPNSAYVSVCSVGSLDGLRLVRDWTQGDRKQ